MFVASDDVLNLIAQPFGRLNWTKLSAKDTDCYQVFNAVVVPFSDLNKPQLPLEPNWTK